MRDRPRARLRRMPLIAAALLAACAPKVPPLTGVAPAHGTMLPFLSLAPGHRRVDFHWELNDPSMALRGDGVARLAGPDSARVDLFLGGGSGGAAAILIGDSLRTPPRAMGVDLVPPAPLLWAALGRLAIPALADTVIRVAGDTLRATVGAPVRWRIQAVHDSLRRLDRVSGDRLAEWVERSPDGTIRYELAGRRSLVLHIERDTTTSPFDASIWHF